MNPVLKNALWGLWSPMLAIMSIVDWHHGDLSGYWTIVICFMALSYLWESTLRAVLLHAYELTRKTR
jgi:hypothetical protein